MSSENGSLESIAEGATKAILEWSSERLKELIVKFKNKELAFIKDKETISIVKEQRETSEWAIFSQYVKNTDIRVLFQMGLTLRALEKQNKLDSLNSLREKILSKYDTKGLHVSQTVQNGIFSKYIGNILERATTPQKLKFEIENLFNNIDNTVIFIQTGDDIAKTTRQISTKIFVNSPKTFIISSAGSAMNKCEEIKNGVIKEVSNYTCEIYGAENKKIYFLNKKEEIN